MDTCKARVAPTCLLYKCPGLKSKDFKSQEKRERKIGKTVGIYAVRGGGDRQKARKKEKTELTITTKGRDRDKEKERVKHVQGTGSPNLSDIKEAL